MFLTRLYSEQKQFAHNHLGVLFLVLLFIVRPLIFFYIISFIKNDIQKNEKAK